MPCGQYLSSYRSVLLTFPQNVEVLGHGSYPKSISSAKSLFRFPRRLASSTLSVRFGSGESYIVRPYDCFFVLSLPSSFRVTTTSFVCFSRQVPRIPQPQARSAYQQFPKDIRVHPQGRLVKKYEPHEPGTRSPALRFRASGLRAPGR